jgi:hypothetical protein
MMGEIFNMIFLMHLKIKLFIYGGLFYFSITMTSFVSRQFSFSM